MENNNPTQNPGSQEEPNRTHQQTGTTGTYRPDPVMPPNPGQDDVPGDMDERPTGGTGDGRDGIEFPENPVTRPPQPGDYQAPAGTRNWSEEQGNPANQNPEEQNRNRHDGNDQNRPQGEQNQPQGERNQSQGQWGDRPDAERTDDEPVQPRD